ncbi:DUF2878 domain-containing protein [Vibrio sp. RC27]
MRVFIISVVFQILWFVAVIGRERYEWALLLVVTALWLVLLWQGRKEIKLLFFFAALGIGIDMVTHSIDILVFDNSAFPIWLVSLWLLFAWYMVFLLPMLKKVPRATVPILFMVGGVFSYAAAMKFSAFTTSYSLPITFSVFAIQWATLGLIAMRIIYYVETIDSSSSGDAA